MQLWKNFEYIVQAPRSLAGPEFRCAELKIFRDCHGGK